MKRLIITAALLLVSTPALAEKPSICRPPLGVQAVEVTAEIVEKFASENYCGKKKPTGKPGQILIWWERDANGRCTVQKAEVVK